MRTAIPQDFKSGQTLYWEYAPLKITKKYDDGIWETRSKSGEKCVFECEAKFYQVEE